MIHKYGEYNTVNNIKIHNNFSLGEFECPCCYRVILDENLAQILFSIREDYGYPIFVTSGYRCHIYNLYVGGEWDSAHLWGRAADIAPHDITLFDQLASVCQSYEEEIRTLQHKKKGYIHVELY